MRSQSARLTLSETRTRLRLTLTAALLFVGAALISTAAFAASGTFSDCDRLATDLKSLDVAADELPLDDAEHLSNHIVDSSVGLIERHVNAAAAGVGAPPVLFLTPRVADIVRDVFDTLPVVAIDDGTDDTGAEENLDLVEPRTPAGDMPPVVRAPSLPRITLPGTRGAASGGAQEVPRFQTPMYRTDI